MAVQPTGESPVELERQLLRALFYNALDDAPVSNFQFPVSSLQALRNYRWLEPLHQVAFEVLISLPRADPGLIREQIAARLTRRGFPDFDLTGLQPQTLTVKEIQRLIDQLSNMPQ
jgi:hypothetical protein